MSVASNLIVAKLPFSISIETLRYGEDDMSYLYSCVSMRHLPFYFVRKCPLKFQNRERGIKNNKLVFI